MLKRNIFLTLAVILVVGVLVGLVPLGQGGCEHWTFLDPLALKGSEGACTLELTKTSPNPLFYISVDGLVILAAARIVLALKNRWSK